MPEKRLWFSSVCSCYSTVSYNMAVIRKTFPCHYAIWWQVKNCTWLYRVRCLCDFYNSNFIVRWKSNILFVFTIINHSIYELKHTRVSHWLCKNHPQHDDVIKWKHFPGYWPYVRRIHRSPVNSPLKGHWHGALMFSLICTEWTTE